MSKIDSPGQQPMGPSFMFRFFGGLFLLLGIAVAVISARELIPFFSDDPSGRLRVLWTEDLENLSHSSDFPEGWLHLKDVRYVVGGAGAEAEANAALLTHVKPYIPTQVDGTYELDVLFDRWKDSETQKRGVLIQYTLINLKTKNTEWELARTLAN